MRKLRKLGPKMLLSLLSTFVAVLGIFLILVIVRTTSLADSLSSDLILSSAKDNGNEMSNEFSKADNLILGLKFAAEQYETIMPENRRKFLDNLLYNTVLSKQTVILGAWGCFEPNALDGLDSSFQNTEVSDGTGRYISYFNQTDNGIAKTYLVDYDVTGAGDYYLVPFETGNAYVTPPYDYEINGKVMTVITFCYPVKNSAGKIVGAVGVDYTLDYINQINDTVHLFETGFGKLLTNKGLTVAHIDRSLLGIVDPDITQAAEAGDIVAALKSGGSYIGKIHSTTLNTTSYKAFVRVPMGNSGVDWVYSVVVPESEVMASTDETIAMILTVGIIGLIAAVIIIFLLSNSISKPVKAMSQLASIIAGGDLTAVVPKKYQKRKDEIGDLSNDLQRMRNGLVETVSGINEATTSLQNQVSNINNALGSLNDRISDTSAATEELSAGMEETGASAEEMNATAIEIENAVGSVAEKAEEGAGKSKEIYARASELGKDVNDSIEKSNQVFSEIKGTLEKALEDSKAVDEINALADAILDITSQTTLLALNASIEAARAGEAGRGFAVVANEIGNLADNSKKTVTQIQQITQLVMTAVNALSKSSSDLLNFVATEVQQDYKDMLKAADSYTNDAIFVSDMTSDLSATSEELLASIQTLLRSINEVSMAAQEGARTTMTVAEQTSDVSLSASIVVENMNETQNTSNDLTSLVSRFKLD